MLLHHFLRNIVVITKFVFWFGVLSISEAAQVRDMSYETVMTVFPTNIALAHYWEPVRAQEYVQRLGPAYPALC